MSSFIAKSGDKSDPEKLGWSEKREYVAFGIENQQKDLKNIQCAVQNAFRLGITHDMFKNCAEASGITSATTNSIMNIGGKK